jgi:putative tryptophan/tyrosine transport system substrate-binding protein
MQARFSVNDVLVSSGSLKGKPVRRRDFITLVGGAAVAWPLAALAQEAGRTYRIGGLSSGPRSSPLMDAMFDEVRRFGFIEGQNLTVYWHQYLKRIDLIPEFAEEFVKAHVDVIFAAGDIAIRAAQRATPTIPILGTTENMVGSGLVKSLARPGGNTTGTSILAADLDGKRQELLTEAVPGLRRMAALADSNSTPSPQLQALQDAARARNVELSIHRITSAEEITPAIDAAKTSGAEALNVLSAPSSSAVARLLCNALRHCTFRRFINFRKKRTKVVLLPTAHVWSKCFES